MNVVRGSLQAQPSKISPGLQAGEAKTCGVAQVLAREKASHVQLHLVLHDQGGLGGFFGWPLLWENLLPFDGVFAQCTIFTNKGNQCRLH